MNEPKKLYRSRKNRMIAGVCAGLAIYFNIDVILVRVIFVALAFADGLGLIIYLVLMIVVPEAKAEEDTVLPPANQMTPTRRWFDERRNLLAIIIVLIGVFALLKELFVWRWADQQLFWAVALIAVGIFLITKK